MGLEILRNTSIKRKNTLGLDGGTGTPSLRYESTVTPEDFKQSTYRRLMAFNHKKRQKILKKKIDEIKRDQKRAEDLQLNTESNNRIISESGKPWRKLVQRMDDIIDFKQQKQRFMRDLIQKERLCDELRECTFHPNLRKKSSRRSFSQNSQKSEQKKRTIEDLMNWQEKKLMKRLESQIKKSSMKEVFDPTPKILAKSKKIIKEKRSREGSLRRMSVEQRLMDLQRQKEEKLRLIREKEIEDYFKPNLKKTRQKKKKRLKARAKAQRKSLGRLRESSHKLGLLKENIQPNKLGADYQGDEDLFEYDAESNRVKRSRSRKRIYTTKSGSVKRTLSRKSSRRSRRRSLTPQEQNQMILERLLQDSAPHQFSDMKNSVKSKKKLTRRYSSSKQLLNKREMSGSRKGGDSNSKWSSRQSRGYLKDKVNVFEATPQRVRRVYRSGREGGSCYGSKGKFNSSRKASQGNSRSRITRKNRSQSTQKKRKKNRGVMSSSKKRRASVEELVVKKKLKRCGSHTTRVLSTKKKSVPKNKKLVKKKTKKLTKEKVKAPGKTKIKKSKAKKRGPSQKRRVCSKKNCSANLTPKQFSQRCDYINLSRPFSIRSKSKSARKSVSRSRYNSGLKNSAKRYSHQRSHSKKIESFPLKKDICSIKHGLRRKSRQGSACSRTGFSEMRGSGSNRHQLEENLGSDAGDKSRSNKVTMFEIESQQPPSEPERPLKKKRNKAKKKRTSKVSERGWSRFGSQKNFEIVEFDNLAENENDYKQSGSNFGKNSGEFSSRLNKESTKASSRQEPSSHRDSCGYDPHDIPHHRRFKKMDEDSIHPPSSSRGELRGRRMSNKKLSKEFSFGQSASKKKLENGGKAVEGYAANQKKLLEYQNRSKNQNKKLKKTGLSRKNSVQFKKKKSVDGSYKAVVPVSTKIQNFEKVRKRRKKSSCSTTNSEHPEDFHGAGKLSARKEYQEDVDIQKYPSSLSARPGHLPPKSPTLIRYQQEVTTPREAENSDHDSLNESKKRMAISPDYKLKANFKKKAVEGYGEFRGGQDSPLFFEHEIESEEIESPLSYTAHFDYKESQRKKAKKVKKWELSDSKSKKGNSARKNKKRTKKADKIKKKQIVTPKKEDTEEYIPKSRRKSAWDNLRSKDPTELQDLESLIENKSKKRRSKPLNQPEDKKKQYEKKTPNRRPRSSRKAKAAGERENAKNQNSKVAVTESEQARKFLTSTPTNYQLNTNERNILNRVEVSSDNTEESLIKNIENGEKQAIHNNPKKATTFEYFDNLGELNNHAEKETTRRRNRRSNRESLRSDQIARLNIDPKNVGQGNGSDEVEIATARINQVDSLERCQQLESWNLTHRNRNPRRSSRHGSSRHRRQYIHKNR